mmetsp:Transcript_767/g.2439  ORF Transcript_767/g.2439 Transcript_767/m.2439 type:complete len:522 (-) Transcript_767:292-1857(-)
MSLAMSIMLASMLLVLGTGASDTPRPSGKASASGAVAAAETSEYQGSTVAATSPSRLRGSVATPWGADPLEAVGGDGGSAVPALRPCAWGEECLQIIDEFLARQPKQQGRNTSLVQTYGSAPPGGGGPCGALCDLAPHCMAEDGCRYFVYDNAVAAIYLTHRGKLPEARAILDSLRLLLYPQPGSLALLRSAYAEDGGVLDASIDTGNNAWVGMAFAHYAAASGEACYAIVARDILHSLAEQAGCDDELQGFMGRPRHRGYYRNTEHNVDMFALSRMLGEKDLQARAATFVSRMYGISNRTPEVYATNTVGKVICDTSIQEGNPIATDAQVWNLLSQADPDADRKRTSLEFIFRPAAEGGLLTEDVDIIGDGAHLAGLRFTNNGTGAQWENTASAVMGIGFYESVYNSSGRANVSGLLPNMRDALLHQLREYRSVLSSVRGGNYKAWLQAYTQGNADPAFPGGSDTGIGWTYLRYPHVSATAWTGLMLLEANPFAVPANSRTLLTAGYQSQPGAAPVAAAR